MIDLDRFLDALDDVESASGANDYPRFEPAFAPAGGRWTIQGRVVTGTGRSFTPTARVRWDAYGMASACSYSRWQILYHTAADLGFGGHPAELWARPHIAQFYVEKFIRKHMDKGATTVEQLADAYNSGNFFDAIIPVDYISKVVAAYALHDPTRIA